MYWDFEWDDENVLHATRHGYSVAEIEQAVINASGYRKSTRREGRIEFRSRTDGGRRVKVIAEMQDRSTLRIVTALESL